MATMLKVTSLLALLVGCSMRGPVVDPFPAEGAIKTIEFRGLDIDSYQIPSSLWPQLFSALKPARVDYSPKKWAVIGDLEITEQDDSTWHGSLYEVLDDEVGAFDIGRTYESRIYHRGGNSAALIRVLEKAKQTPQSSL